MKHFLSIVFFVLALTLNSRAQCDAGFTEIMIIAYSYDVWGEESYYELVPSGNGCGNETILSGGSEEVGCAGFAPTGENGIPDYGAEVAGPICVPDGQMLDLVFVDWYGDGGYAFDVFMDGVHSGSYWGTGLGNTWTFQAGVNPLPAFDSPCGALQVFPDAATVTLNNSQCVAPFLESNLLTGSCATFGMWCEGDATQTAWAYFIADGNKSYEITSCNTGTSFDTQIAVFHGVNCGEYWNFELISSNDDMWGGCGEANGYASQCYASCLEAGDAYYIMVDGFAGQVGDAVISVTTYNGEISLSAQVNDMVCPLDKGQTPTGSIFPSIIGTGSDFTCEWTGDNGFNSTEHFVYNLGPGEYELTATSACDAIFTGTYTINQPDAWNVDVDSTPASCPDAEDGVISVDASGATPGYNYAYSGPGNYSANGQTVTNAPMGNITVTVTDANGCNYVDEADIEALDDLTFDLGPDTTICLGETVVVYGPTDLNYLWQDGSVNQFYEIDTDEWGSGTAALVLTAYTDDGCTHTDAYIFTVEICIGVNESLQNEISIYPNPNNGVFQFMNDSMETMVVTDMAGRMVYKSINLKAGLNEFNLPLAQGVYCMNFYSSEGQVVVRMVVE